MAHKTDMTAKLLLLAAAVYALLSLVTLTGRIYSAKDSRDAAAEEVLRLQSRISALNESAFDSADIESAARNELKMVRRGEKLILLAP